MPQYPTPKKSVFLYQNINQLNITRNDIDELNALLQLKLTTEDYLPEVNASLKKIRKQVQMKGFRPVYKIIYRKMS